MCAYLTGRVEGQHMASRGQDKKNRAKNQARKDKAHGLEV